MSYYLTAIEGMPELLDSAELVRDHFTKKSYSDSFQKCYEKHKPTLEALEQGYLMVIDQEQYLINMADALAAEAVRQLEQCTRKSKKDQKMIDMNLAMVAYIIPMILEYQGQSSKMLSEKLLMAWKREFPKTNLQAAPFSEIEKGFHKKYCYITTAVCRTFGKPDECYELTLFRDYRDHYLASLEGGGEIIRRYYDLAPSIVKHIDQRADAKEIYGQIWQEYLSPCISMIEQGKLEECRICYEQMVETMKEKYFIIN